MHHHRERRAFVRSALLPALLAALPSYAEDVTAKLERARTLVDDYYGDRSLLEEASRLVNEALAAKPPMAEAYVQAARITIKGGHIVSLEFRKGTVGLYEQLIDRALAIEPNHPDALSLKSEACMIRGDVEGARRALEQGLKFWPNHGWLLVSLGDLQLQTRDWFEAMRTYDRVLARPPAPTDARGRRPYVAALAGRAHYQAWMAADQVDKLRLVAQQVEQWRHPKDAWVLGEMSRVMSQVGAFDDGVAYARKSLAVMNYGAGRTNLAIALWGRAAQLEQAGEDSSAVVAQAAAVGADPDRIHEWFVSGYRKVEPLAPTVARLLQRSYRGWSPQRRPG